MCASVNSSLWHRNKLFWRRSVGRSNARWPYPQTLTAKHGGPEEELVASLRPVVSLDGCNPLALGLEVPDESQAERITPRRERDGVDRVRLEAGLDMDFPRTRLGRVRARGSRRWGDACWLANS